MEYITICLDSINKVEHWYVRHKNVYCFQPWAICFNLYTGHLPPPVHGLTCTGGH